MTYQPLSVIHNVYMNLKCCGKNNVFRGWQVYSLSGVGSVGIDLVSAFQFFKN